MIPLIGIKRDLSLIIGNTDSNPRPTKQTKVTAVAMEKIKNMSESEEFDWDASTIEDESPQPRNTLSSESGYVDEDDSMTEPSDTSDLESSSLGELDIECTLPECWEEALVSLDEGDDTSVMLLLNDEESKKLSSEQKELLMDNLLSCNKPEILTTSVNLNLPMPIRFDLLKKGIDLDCFSTVSAAIDGIPGQKKIDFDEWSGREPLTTIIALKNKRVNQEIIFKLIFCSSLSTDDLFDAEMKKIIFNIADLSGGAFEVNNETVEYEGTFHYLFCTYLQIWLKNFEEKNDIPEAFHELDFLTENSFSDLSPIEKMDIYEKYGSLLIHGGNEEHAIDILFYKKFNKDFMLICNPGLGGMVPIDAYEIKNKDHFNEKLFKDIENRTLCKRDEMISYYTKELPILLSGDTECHPLTTLFNEAWFAEMDQTGENCQIKSLMASFSAYSAMFSLQGNVDEARGHVQKAFQDITDLCRSFKYWIFTEYLLYCEHNLKRMDNHLIQRVLKCYESIFSAELIDPLKQKFWELCIKQQSLESNLQF